METSAAPAAASIDRWQQKRQQAFKQIPDEGRTIRYLGKDFHVYPNTFWPFNDSQPLVRNFRIEPGDSVLDVGTGSGVIAVFACYRGAGRVLALDVNPAAIRSAKRNAREHGFGNVMEVRRSNLFEKVGDEQFDVITANLPFRNKFAHDVVARSQWDTDFRTNTEFFAQVRRHMKTRRPHLLRPFQLRRSRCGAAPGEGGRLLDPPDGAQHGREGRGETILCLPHQITPCCRPSMRCARCRTWRGAAR
ncbi:methyltransferase [Pseudoduganella sp. UC29_106]|uniref:methyltransferase n=1 Tax=Pseudoduganella sp. UC29_106 TaxID=3374553 RepID=UPI003757E801